MTIVTEKYNRSYGRSFASPNAVQKYLGPVGLSLDKEPGLDFPENQTRFSVQEEQAIFKAIHFCRWHITNGNPRLKRKWERLHDALRSRAVNANMGLVFKCIEMSQTKHWDFDDLTSAGRFALLRSVDSFDPWRGFRFSTYACIAILQGLTREAQSFNGKFNYQSDVDPDNVLVHEEHEDGDEEVILRLKKILKNGVLSRREKNIIRDRFGIGKEPKTLGEVGKELNVSKERIRQIQIRAFNKLRAALDNTCATVKVSPKE